MTQRIHKTPGDGPAGALAPINSWQQQPGELAASVRTGDFGLMARTQGPK